GQVLGGGRRAHGERALAVRVEGGEGGADLLLEFRREWRLDDPLADLGAGRGQFADVFVVEGAEAGGDALVQAGGLEEVAEGFGGRGEAARHADSRAGQLADHLT